MMVSEIYIGGGVWALADGERVRLRYGPPDDPHYVWLDEIAFNVIQALTADMRDNTASTINSGDTARTQAA